MNQTIASHLHGMSTSRHARYTALLSSRRQVPHVTEKVAAMKNGIQYQDTLDQLINGAGGPSTNGSAQLENAYDRQSSRVPNTASIVRSWWSTVPSRTKLVAACGSAFVISNLDKVNMTVAVIPIAQELGWSSTVTGLVQSSFFWGFLLAQVPGGYMSSCIGGRRTLPPSVALWSVTTALLPLTAINLPALCVTRSVMGAGEAVAPSAVVDMLARSVPIEQRAGAVSAAFSGLHVGSVLGLLASPAIIEAFGWRSLFLTFGVIGLVWCIAFQELMKDIGRQDPELLKKLEASWNSPPSTPSASADFLSRQDDGSKSSNARSSNTDKPAAASVLHIPYRAMLRSRPVQALAYTHFAHNWLHYTCLAWLPTYFVDTLSVDLMHASQAALMPPLAGILTASVAGRAADGLIALGAPVAAVRKAAQCTAFLVPSALLTSMCLSAGDGGSAAEAAAEGIASAGDALATDSALASMDALVAGLSSDALMTVASMTLALGTSAFSLAGLYCTHQDLSPRYSSAMLGVTNTAAGMSGVVGVALVGFLLDQTGSWELSLLAPSIFFLTTGAAAYTLFGSNDSIDFDVEDDSPFPFEERIRHVKESSRNFIRALPFHVSKAE